MKLTVYIGVDQKVEISSATTMYLQKGEHGESIKTVNARRK